MVTTAKSNNPGIKLSFGTVIKARTAVFLGLLLSQLSPHYIEMLLKWVSKEKRPLDYQQAAHAYHHVRAVSIACWSDSDCLRRSLAVFLLVRMGGVYVSWCVGVRTQPPFMAHAWVEAEGIG
ncbi:MAG: lasso peptide biosynthesis B2 protein, partial [Nitrososphaera sp.]